MALRVLLADESSTIKKVIQLALQDFGVEVKSVSAGVDVITVAHNFRPDIVLTDILLAKRNGYEVCGDLKKDPELQHIPVVLMWSGFMEIDETKVRAAKPDRRLEKPFDADTLRNLIKELVPKTQSNVISNYLSFPELPEILPDQSANPPSPLPSSTDAKVVTKSVIVDFDEPEEFQQVPLPKNRKSQSQAQLQAEKLSESIRNHQDLNEPWAQHDLSKFKIQLPPDEDSLISENFEESDLSGTSIALSNGLEEIELADLDLPNPKTKQNQPNLTQRISEQIAKSAEPKMQASPLYVDTTRAEEILREEARNVVKDIAWQLLPGICERVVREELEKLLKAL